MIRRAGTCDIPRICELLRQVCRTHHEGRPDLFKDGTKYTKEELEHLLKDESRPVLVFVDESEVVVGYVFCVIQENAGSTLLQNIRTLYIDDLCVDEGRRGEKIGTALYGAAVDLARELGCYNLTLNVWSLNKGAMRFYEGLGLVPQKVGMELIL